MTANGHWPTRRSIASKKESAAGSRFWVPTEGRDGKRAAPANLPARTMTSRAETALALPAFIAELRGGSCDARAITDPLSTVTASGNHHALISSYFGTGVGPAPSKNHCRPSPRSNATR